MKMLISFPGSFQMKPRSQEQVSIRKESEEGSPPARPSCSSLPLTFSLLEWRDRIKSAMSGHGQLDTVGRGPGRGDRSRVSQTG